MRQRYCADALVAWPEDMTEGYDDSKATYQTFWGKTLKEAIQKAEDASLVSEAVLVGIETYRPEYNDWIFEHIDQ